MKELTIDVAVIGGGPAGMAAALEAERLGVKVALLERNFELGGILQQCIHDGFGLQRFGVSMAGSSYAQKFIDEIEKAEMQVFLDTMVLEITEEKTIYACSSQEGMIRLQCGAIILAMGCRERTAGQILLYGHRPQGVMTAGSVQRYINMEGYLPGKKAVILGSGDIGLIMARRMVLEGIEVKGVYEVMSSPGGLTRNIVQCLEDFEIPLYLFHTVTRIRGKHHLEGVTVMKLDGERKPIPGTEKEIDCDLLVLAVGLIPENELSVQAGVEMDERTRGPLLDEDYMTSIPGIFAAGNVSLVFDLVDYVSQSGEIAARGAVKYLQGKINSNPEYEKVQYEGNVQFVVPQRIRKGEKEKEVVFFLRVKHPARRVELICTEKEQILVKKKLPTAAPPEMLSCQVKISPGQSPKVQIPETGNSEE